MKQMLVCLMLVFGGISMFAQNNLRSANIQSAMSALREGDKENALQYLVNELEDNPTNGYAYAFVATIIKKENYKAALLQYAGKAIQYLPASESGLINEMIEVCGNVYDKGGDSIRAEKMYDRGVMVNRNNMSAHLARAGFYDNHDDYQRLLTEGNECIRLAKNEPNGYYVAALAQLGLKNYPEAIRQAELAVAKVSTENKGLHASALATAARAECAMQHYDRAIALTTQSLRIRLNSQAIKAAYALADSTDGKMLIDSLKPLLTELPTEDWVPGMICDVYERNNDYIHSTYYLFQSLKIEKSSHTYRAIADNYLHNFGSAELAEKYFRLAIEQDSTDAKNYFMLGDLYHDLGRYDEALRYMNKAVEMGAADGMNAYYFRGRVYRDMHDYQAAIADYRRQLVNDPENPGWAFTIGETYMQIGDTAHAEQYFELGRQILGDKPMQAEYKIAMREWSEAMELALTMVTREKSASQHYNKACVYAQAYDTKTAMAELERAFELGFRNFYHIVWDDDLDNIRSLPEFGALVQRYQTICLEEQKQLEELIKQ